MHDPQARFCPHRRKHVGITRDLLKPVEPPEIVSRADRPLCFVDLKRPIQYLIARNKTPLTSHGSVRSEFRRPRRFQDFDFASRFWSSVPVEALDPGTKPLEFV